MLQIRKGPSNPGPVPKGAEGGSLHVWHAVWLRGCRFSLPDIFQFLLFLPSSAWHNWVSSDHSSGLWASQQDKVSKIDALLQLLVPFTYALLSSFPWKPALITWWVGLLVTINQAEKDLFWTLLKPSKVNFHTQSRGCWTPHGLASSRRDCTYWLSEHQVGQKPEIHPRNH